MAVNPEDLNRLMGAIELINNQITNLQQEFQQLRQAGAHQGDRAQWNSLVDKNYRPEKFTGEKFTAWADDVKAWLGIKRLPVKRAINWGGGQKDNRIGPGDAEDGAPKRSRRAEGRP